jgi:hypothetical protein
LSRRQEVAVVVVGWIVVAWHRGWVPVLVVQCFFRLLFRTEVVVFVVAVTLRLVGVAEADRQGASCPSVPPTPEPLCWVLPHQEQRQAKELQVALLLLLDSHLRVEDRWRGCGVAADVGTVATGIVATAIVVAVD